MTEIEKIYSEYFVDVYKYALSLCQNEALAEEITQETFFKALKNIQNFRGDCKMVIEHLDQCNDCKNYLDSMNTTILFLPFYALSLYF